MSNRYESATICRDSYETYGQYKAAVVNFVEILLQNEYIVVLKDEGMLTYIEYNYRDVNLSEHTPKWVHIEEEIISPEGDNDDNE